MYGGTTREDPEYPGTLSIPDTVSVRWYVWGDNLVFRTPDTVSVRLYVWGDNSGGSRVSRDTKYSGHCVYK